MAGDDPLSRRVGEASVVREVFEQLPSMVVGLRGADHTYVAANAAYRKYLHGRPDLLGRPVREVLPEIDGHRLHELLDRVYRTGEPESGREWRIQLAMDGPNGDRAGYLDFTVTPQLAGEEIIGLVVQVQDVTDRVLARGRCPEGVSVEEQGRESLIALQEALLPDGLPVLPGVDIAGRYLVAEASDAGGGDWFDAVPLGDGRVALMVGDVVGHGTAAVAVMGQLRAVIADQFAEGADLDTVIRRARRYAERNPAARSATMCVVVLDPGTGALSYATCGHPAPLVVTPRGRARFLPLTGGTPLGTGGASPAVPAVLAAEEVLVLYTDGLVERPGEPPSAGQSELAAVIADTVADRVVPGASRTSLARASVARRVCAQTVELVAGHTTLDDDVTVLVAQRRAGPAAAFEQDMPARAGLLALLRQRLETWLRTLGAGSEDLFNAQIAVVEAVTNSVEHAYPGGGGEVRIRGRLDGRGEVELTVRDFGRWRPVDPEPGLRGRGLVLIRRCMHSVAVDPGADGTSVVMRRLLRGDAFLDPRATGQPPTRSDEPGTEYGSSVRTAAPGERVRVVVRGPVDTVTAPRLRATLNEAGRGGVLPLTVDLRETTHLGSSGIQLLADLAASGDGRQPLRLVAAPGSIARYVLDMTGLGHLVHDPDEPGAG